MKILQSPLNLLKYLQTFFPDVKYLTQDKTGECHVFEERPIRDNENWGAANEYESCFKLSSHISQTLI